MNVDGLHIPNLIIADKMYFDCIDSWKVNEVRENVKVIAVFLISIKTMSFAIGYLNKKTILDSLII
jgi:hypothetical protein